MAHDLTTVPLFPVHVMQKNTPEGGEGVESHKKQTGMLVVPLRAVNFGLALGVQGTAPIYYKLPRETEVKFSFLTCFVFVFVCF